MRSVFGTAAVLLLSAAQIAHAEITVADAYARASMPGAATGAAFFVLSNDGPEDDMLIGVRSDAAARVELHTHMETGDGVMRMVPVDGGIALPAGQSHVLERGGDHVMFMGLSEPFAQGQEVSVTLIFEQAGEMDVTIPVDLER